MTGAGACPWRLVPLLALWPVSTWSAPSAGNGAAVDEVRITARRDALQESRGAVAQKMVVERGELKAMGVLTVGEALKKLPGIDGGVSSGDGVPTANARGKTTYSAKLALGRRDAAANSQFSWRTCIDAIWWMPIGFIDILPSSIYACLCRTCWVKARTAPALLRPAAPPGVWRPGSVANALGFYPWRGSGSRLLDASSLIPFSQPESETCKP